jgi:hypothetical protein
VPFSGAASDPLKVGKLFRASVALRNLFAVTVPMLLPCDAGQVADVVVRGIAVDVVDVHPFGYWPVVVYPDIPVKTVPRPCKVPPMRRVIALRISVVSSAIEDNRLNSHAF